MPVHNEAHSLRKLSEKVHAVLDNQTYRYELIFVNDGSKDRSWEIIQELSQNNRRIKGIDLAGNYGQTMALRAGIEKAKGDVVVAMDGDLQHDPIYIPQFLQLIEEGYDMVGGYKETDSRSTSTALLSKIAHWLICQLSGVRLKYFGATFRAYRTYLLKQSHLMGDSHRFLAALLSRKGIRQTEIPIRIEDRIHGKSNYSWKKIFIILPDLIFLKFIVSFMNKPFRLFGSIGAVSFLSGFFLSILLIGLSLFSSANIKEEYISEFIFSLISMTLGAILLCFGIVAEIGVHTYFLKSNRSPYCIREQTGISKNKVRMLSSHPAYQEVQGA